METEGDIHFEKGSTDAAISIWERSASLFPSAGVTLKLAKHYTETLQLEKAKVICLEQAEQDPMNDKIWLMLGHVFMMMNLPGKALDAAQRAYNLDISSPDYNCYLGVTLVYQAMHEESEPFEDNQLKFPFSTSPLYERSIYHLNFCIRNSQPVPDIWSFLGRAYFETNKYSNAAKAFAEYVRQQPKSRAGWNNLALSYYMLGELGKAMSASKEATCLDPEESTAIDTMGRILLRKGNIDGALNALNYAVKLDPENIEAWCNLAEAYARAGNIKEAKDNYQKARQLDPTKTWQWAINNPDQTQVLHAETTNNQQT